MLAEEAEPQPPQRIGAGEHHLHQPARMGAAVEAERQLQHVLEIVGEHDLAALVRELVGIERDEGAADDQEQAEPDPGSDEGRELRPVERAAVLGAGERIDDAAEQHGLCERRRGQRDIGEGEQPAEPHLRPEQAEHPGIEAHYGHGESTRNRNGVRSGAFSELGLRRPIPHARRPVGLGIEPLQRLNLVIAARIGHEAGIEAPAASAPWGVIIGQHRRAAAAVIADRGGDAVWARRLAAP